MSMTHADSRPSTLRTALRGALVVLLTALWTGCVPAAPPYPQTRAASASPPPSRVVVITDLNYPPYVMQNKDGILEGIVPDLWRAWEGKTGIPVEIRAFSWSEAQDRFSRGEGDVIETIFDTPERRSYLTFSPPYARIPVPVFVHSSITGISGAKDLRGFKVAVKSGDASIVELVRLGVSDLSLYDSYKAIAEAAARHEVRIFCVDGPPAFHYLYKLGIDREFVEAFILNEGAFSRAVRHGEESLLALVQREFDDLPRAEVAAINRRWMGSELPRRPDWRIIGGLGILAALLLAFLFGVAVNLRLRVNRATQELKEKIVQLQDGEQRITKTLREKEVLLQEIHHRVKNNLQIISSLIRLQSEDLISEEAREMLRGTQSRISAMSNLHDRLYNGPDLEHIDAADYIRALVDDLATTFSYYGISYDARPVELSIEAALPLGLIVNECAVNAVKYAYPDRKSGAIEIRLSEENGECVCSVRDSGRGLPPDVDPETASSMGFTIVRSLVSQLKGRVRFDSSPGFSVEFRFPFPGEAAGNLP